MQKHINKILIFAVILGILDQITKGIAIKYFQVPYVVITDLFRLQYSENTGIAFSIPVPYLILITFNFLLILLILFFAKKEFKMELFLTQLALGLLIGGGVANLIDRVRLGFVIDFISIWKYPIFNLADVYITLGVLLLLLFYAKIKRSKNTKTNGRNRSKSSNS